MLIIITSYECFEQILYHKYYDEVIMRPIVYLLLYLHLITQFALVKMKIGLDSSWEKTEKGYSDLIVFLA